MNNAQVIEGGLRKAMDIIDFRTTSALEETAFDLVNMTEVPVWTHNLWDSVGCGIYRNGVLIKYSVPPTVAVDPRSGDKEFPLEARSDPMSAFPIWGSGLQGLDKDAAYWGTVELFEMLERPPMDITSHKGWALYYVAAMPYSQIIDKKYDVLQEEHIQPLFFTHIRKYDSN
jgi:hypothetical protein